MYDIIHVIHDTVNRSHHTCDRLSVIHDTSVSCDGNTCRNTDVSASALVVPRGPRLSFLSDPTVTVPARILEDRVDCKVYRCSKPAIYDFDYETALDESYK